MGDVALTLPAVRGALDENPNLRITILTRKFFAPFFANIDRLEVFAPDLNGRHKGIKGLSRLYRDLKATYHFDLVLDLHSVIRSQFLRTRFRLSGIQTFSIKKERKEKKKYLKSKLEPNLLHSVERYTNVFNEAGIKCIPLQGKVLQDSTQHAPVIDNFLIAHNLNEKKLIGFAPFAKHELKMWPQNKVEELIKLFSSHSEIHIVLFGGGKEEIEKINSIASKNANCVVPDLKFEGELALIKRLSAMVSMDSSNMHMAALSGIPVVSIWGATHPGIGFYAWGQPSDNSIQIAKSELGCRPCTIYGKGECARKDFACMEWIEVDQVFYTVLKILN